jgi:predicted  nucleic acid-binding Zn-ribbon protein
LQGQIDALENQYLEALEEQDRLDLREGIEQDSIRNHQEQSLKITDKLENLRLITLNRLDAIATQTASLLTQMNPSVANRYRLMNEKLERAVVAVRKDACGGCYNKLPTELLWTALHRSTICFCPYCSVFLIPSEVD